MPAHVDVVEVRRKDWTRNLFTLIEGDGYFYARGMSDMKTQAAIWVDNFVRIREQGFKPKRSVKLALTREEIDAEFAITAGIDGVAGLQQLFITGRSSCV